MIENIIKKTTAIIFASAVLFSCGKEVEDIAVFNEIEPVAENAGSEDIISGIPEVTTVENKKSVTTAVETEAAKKAEINKNTEVEKKEENPEADKKPDPDPAAAFCIEAPYFSQHDYPTGCELVSTSMLLAYYGFDISAGELIDGGYVASSEFEEDPDDENVVYGGDPNYAYIGDPRNNKGYGCYSGAIADGLDKYLENEYYDCYYLTGMDLHDICSQYIDFGEPVLIWASIDMQPLYYVDGASWIIKDTGENFTWLSNEHCMLLVGYDDYYYYLHDPLKGAFTAYDRDVTEMRFAEMGYQAVTIRSW